MVDGGIAAIGECMIELSGGAAQSSWRMGFAGDTFNTLWALRALLSGKPCDYVTAFGDDPFSQKQIAFMHDHGVGVAESPVIPGARPGLYAITLDGAERSFTYWRSDAAARRLADDPARLRKSLENRALVYFSGITLAILEPPARKILIAEIDRARQTGAIVAFDPNYRPRLWASVDAAKAAITEALTVTSIALPTFPDEQALYGDADPAETASRLSNAGIGEIIVKNGEEPALAAWDGQSRSIAAMRVEAVDTTGAGDSFNGGYLAARLLGDAPDDAVLKAHRTAAAVVQVRGALAPFEILKTAFSS